MPLTPEEEAQIEIDNPIDQQIASELSYLNEPQGPVASPDQSQGPDQGLVTSPSHYDPSVAATLTPEEEAHLDQHAPLGVKVSSKGFGPDTGQGTIWQKGYEQFQQNDARLAANRDTDLSQYNAAYGQVQTAIGRNADVEAGLNRAHADILQNRENFIREESELDKTMYAQARAESEQHLNAYRQQIAAVRQMTVTNPIQALGPMEAGGLSLAMFAQGFLAAQGIHIDVAGQVDRWVDRSIEEQRRRIGQAEAGAEDQLNLWRIAQDTSRNDLEARQRYRGMVLEAMTTAVDINAARFAAPLAQSAAEVAKAKLTLEKTGVEHSIRHNYETERLANLKAMRDEAHMRVMERFRSQELAIQRAKADKAAKDLVKVPDPGATVRDPSTHKIIGIKNGWAINPNAPVGLQTSAGEFAAKEGGAYGNFVSQLDTLCGLRAPAQDDYKERFGPNWLKAYSEDYRNYKRQKDLVGEQLITYMTGAAAPEQQMKRLTGILADDSVFQEGGNAQGIDQLEKWSRNNFVSKANAHPGLISLPESERDIRPYVNETNDTDVGYNARFGDHLPTTSVVAKEEGAGAVGSDEEVKVTGVAGISTPYATFTGKTGQSVSTAGEPAFAAHFEQIALAAIDPVTVAKKHGSDEDPQKIAQDAAARLDYLAKDKTLPDDRRSYAAYLAERLKTDPTALQRDLVQDPLAFH